MASVTKTAPKSNSKRVSFYDEMIRFVHDHGAVNNVYLDRFTRGDFTKDEFLRFVVEFYHFSRNFPMILAQLLVNTPDEDEAKELTKILVSELGDMDPSKRHELMYREFLRSIGVDPKKVMFHTMEPSTKAYIYGMMRLYGGRDHHRALGASFGLENMAITMWDHLIPGISVAKKRWFPRLDPAYFTFHRQLEETHEDAMEAASTGYEGNLSAQKSFKKGCKQVLDYLEGFWLGLEASKGEPFKSG
jgi:pyrroloquinoline quinone (PQQ) biosynthesis protein C